MREHRSEFIKKVMDLQTDLVLRFREILGEKLTGIYIHGSIAFGCFHWERSDMDFLVVVEENLTLEEKLQIHRWILSVQEDCPPKGLEMSVVEKQVCRHFVYPTPYLYHFSNSHLERARRDPVEYCTHMQGTDRDLAAHIAVIREYGIVLDGARIEKVFDPVPMDAYLDSLLYDVDNMEADIVENPVYCTLNLCRVMAYCRAYLILSKPDGGNWALRFLDPEWHDIIRQAVDAYGTGTPMTAEPERLQRFAGYCLETIREKHRTWREYREQMW